MRPSYLYRVYRDHLSDYQEDKASKKWHPASIITKVDTSTGGILEKKPLYVFKPENLGEKMCIDDKQIAKDGFTILSNAKTGKMAMMLETRTKAQVKAALALFSKFLWKVKEVSCDMSSGYINACQEAIPFVRIVIDKFHVMQYVYNAVSDVKNRIKKELSDKLSKGKERTKEDKRLLEDITLLQHVRHLLWKSPEDWNSEGAALMQQIFEKFPTLWTAYNLAQILKQWYDKSNCGKTKKELQRGLNEWYRQVDQSKIQEFASTRKMIEKHEENIMNYFVSAHTNAKAECLNGKLQRFFSNAYGWRDKDFALFRTAIYFS
ncbi:hypothetical protein AGMMS49982_05550 [Bacteroidia bacterium]|nr:hypothetical protein AGMMS49982_05550 [Bacteroidia bacterium]